MLANGITSLDNGVCKTGLFRNHAAQQVNTVLSDNAPAPMGACLPCAMAVRLVFTERKAMEVS
jgi:acetolactate synthase-1/2/3 large subunit